MSHKLGAYQIYSYFYELNKIYEQLDNNTLLYFAVKWVINQSQSTQTTLKIERETRIQFGIF